LSPGGYFYPGACSRGKIATLNLARTESPTHTEVRVFMVFVQKLQSQQSLIARLIVGEKSGMLYLKVRKSVANICSMLCKIKSRQNITV
jgi:hypothetical protein